MVIKEGRPTVSGSFGFMHNDPGYIDLEEKDCAASKEPFWPKTVSYVSGTFCKGCLRPVQKGYGGEGGIRIRSLCGNKGVLRRSLAF